MKVEIIRNASDAAIGWKLLPETEEEKLTLGTIRQLVFWGYKESLIEYDGIRSEEFKHEDGKITNRVQEIRWIQSQYQTDWEWSEEGQKKNDEEKG